MAVICYNPDRDKTIIRGAFEKDTEDGIKEYIMKEYKVLREDIYDGPKEKLCRYSIPVKEILNNIGTVLWQIKQSKYMKKNRHKNEIMCDEKLKKIVRTPVFLPYSCFYELSGIVLFYVLDEKRWTDIIELNKDKDDYTLRNRFFGSHKKTDKDYSYVDQFKSALNLDLSGLKHKNNKLWDFFLRYDFCDHYSFYAKKRGRGGRPLLHCLDLSINYIFDRRTRPIAYGEAYIKEEVDDKINDLMRLALLRTLIYVNLDDKYKKIIYEYRNMFLRYRNISRAEMDALKTVYISSLVKHEKIPVVVPNVKKTNSGFPVLKPIDDNVEFYIIFRMLQKEELAKLEEYCSANQYTTDSGLPMPNITVNLHKFKVRDEMNGTQTYSWIDFCKKYGNKLPEEFCNENAHWKKMWEIAIKNIVIRFQERWGKNKKDFSEMPKSPKMSWYDENGIDIGSCRIDEIIPMMLLADVAWRKYESEKVAGKISKKMKNGEYLYQRMDNIRKYILDNELIKNIWKECEKIRILSSPFGKESLCMFRDTLMNAYEDCCKSVIEKPIDFEQDYMDVGRELEERNKVLERIIRYVRTQ